MLIIVCAELRAADGAGDGIVAIVLLEPSFAAYGTCVAYF